MPQLATSISSPSSNQLAKRKREPESTPEPPVLIEDQNIPGTRKRKYLRIEIPVFNDLVQGTPEPSDPSPISGLSEPDSLFDEPSTLNSPMSNTPTIILPIPRLLPALLTAPCIPGLFFIPTLRLPEDIADAVMRFCLTTYFHTQGVNQVMLFSRFTEKETTGDVSGMSVFSTGLPPILMSLISTLEALLLPVLPPQTHSLLFPRTPRHARQAILNLYQPGEGISPHVDLLRRFGDGIIGVSLGSGCVMQFAKTDTNEEASDVAHHREQWDVYLPEQSVIVLSEEARYQWTHGIGKHKEDYVSIPDLNGSHGQWIERGVRLSITFRWLLPGADIVGEDGLATVAI